MTIILLLIGLYIASITNNALIAFGTLAIVHIFQDLNMSWLHNLIIKKEQEDE